MVIHPKLITFSWVLLIFQYLKPKLYQQISLNVHQPDERLECFEKIRRRKDLNVLIIKLNKRDNNLSIFSSNVGNFLIAEDTIWSEMSRRKR